MRFACAAALLALCTALPAQPPAPQLVDVINTFTAEVLQNSKLFLPEGSGPFPAVVVMHGSGGLWAGDNPAGGVMNEHFEEMGVLLRDNGYIALFIDSYTVRGIVEFPNRRPAEDPLIDDAVCSDRHVRPTDAYSALAFLRARADVIDDRVGLMGFSHGGQATLVSLTSDSITDWKTTWTVNRLNLDNSTTLVPAPAPYTAEAQTGFRCAVAWYPGCGFYSYFGSSSATADKLYMPAAPTFVIHGDGDALYSGNLYPLALLAKSQSHADFLGLAAFDYPWPDGLGGNESGNNPMYHRLYPGVGHSFDELDFGDAGFDQKEAARADMMAWLDMYLKPAASSVGDWLAYD